MKPTYCFDTSAFLHCAVRHYPIGHFLSMWRELDGLATIGRVIAPEDVLHELGKQDDDVHAWCKERQTSVFVPLDASLMAATTDVLRKFPTLVDQSKGRGRADPFVIALAKLRGATVVTYEDHRPSNPRIPDVCEALGVKWCRMLDVIRAENWKF